MRFRAHGSSTPMAHWTAASSGAPPPRSSRRSRGQGCREGGVVGLALDPARALLPALLAAWDCGATVVLVPPALRAGRARGRHAGPLALADHRRGARCRASRALDGRHAVRPRGRRAAAAARVGASARRGRRRPRGRGAREALVRVDRKPKAVVLTYVNVAAEAANVVAALALGPGDRVVAPVPLTHSYGFDLGVLAVLASGAVVEQRPALSPRRALADMAAATVYLGVPAIYRVAADAPVSSAARTLSSARYLLSCTAPLSPDSHPAFRRCASAPRSASTTASSETGAVANHSPAEVLRAAPTRSAARSAASQVHVAEDTGGARRASGPAVAPAMPWAPRRAPSPLAAGSFRTGDLAEIDVRWIHPHRRPARRR